MNTTDFLIRVTAHPELMGLDGEAAREDGERSPDDVVIVGHIPREIGLAFKISEIQKHTWRDLEAVMTGKRPPSIMVQYTRICGYFARVENFNLSKKAEVRERHAGDYAVPEPQKREEPAHA